MCLCVDMVVEVVVVVSSRVSVVDRVCGVMGKFFCRVGRVWFWL